MTGYQSKRAAAQDKVTDIDGHVVRDVRKPRKLPQRTWVGLTEEEIDTLWQNTSPYYDHQDFARAIEAKLKQKNGCAEEMDR